MLILKKDFKHKLTNRLVKHNPEIETSIDYVSKY